LKKKAPQAFELPRFCCFVVTRAASYRCRNATRLGIMPAIARDGVRDRAGVDPKWPTCAWPSRHCATLDAHLPFRDFELGLGCRDQKGLRSLGLTQQEAAKRMGITQPKVSDMMRGEFPNLSERELMIA
jgi:hypothetical protein